MHHLILWIKIAKKDNNQIEILLFNFMAKNAKTINQIQILLY